MNPNKSEAHPNKVFKPNESDAHPEKVLEPNESEVSKRIRFLFFPRIRWDTDFGLKRIQTDRNFSIRNFR